MCLHDTSAVVVVSDNTKLNFSSYASLVQIIDMEIDCLRYLLCRLSMCQVHEESFHLKMKPLALP